MSHRLHLVPGEIPYGMDTNIIHLINRNNYCNRYHSDDTSNFTLC